MSVDMAVDVGELNLRGPVVAASGTFGYWRRVVAPVAANRTGAVNREDQGVIDDGLTVRELPAKIRASLITRVQP